MHRSSFLFGLLPRLIGAMVVVVALVAGVMTSLATSRLAQSMHAAFESKGEAIALSLAAAFEQSVGTDNATAHGAIDSSKVIAGVKYIFVLDGDGAMQIHTFSPAFPEGFDKVNPVGVGDLGAGQRVKAKADVDFNGPAGRLKVIDVAAPVGGGALGSVHIGMDREIIDRQVAALRATMLGWGLAAALLGLVLGALVVMASVILPVRKLKEVTAGIIATGDLTVKIDVRSRDEIGELATSFAKMVEKLRSITAALHQDAGVLGETVAHLDETTAEQSRHLTRQAAAIQETRVTAQEIKQTSVVAANSAEAVLKTVQNADDVARSGETAIEQSVGGLNEIRAQVAEIADKITGLASRTRQIGGITQSVKDLADQSNILALNAAIEAARSGEHGRGFGVVAREIRSLADQSIEATQRVREILDDVNEAIGRVVDITEKGARRMEGGMVQVRASGENLKELANMVKLNTMAVRQIAAAVGQQSAGVSQIFDSISELSQMMDATVKRLDSSTKAAAQLKDVSTRISDLVKSYRV